MKPDHSPSDGNENILHKILDTLDVAVFTFDKNRKVLFSNALTNSIQSFPVAGSAMGAGEPGHFQKNEYYDEDGNPLHYPDNSAVDRALKGLETHNLLLEHRDKQNHSQRWISISCVPVLDADGHFQYGILWHRDVSLQKSREDKLKFLVASTRILSLTMEFEKRLQEKAKLSVPLLADWCAVDVVKSDGSIKRITLVHRNPEKIALIKEYEQKYGSTANIETNVQKIVRTNKAEFIRLITPDMIDNASHLSEEQKRDIQRLELSSIIIVPMSTSGNVLGVLTFAYAESGRVYTEEDFEFVQEFAQRLSVLVENARLYEEISRRDLSKDAFLSSLSHELRNPLAPIRTGLELMRMKNHDAGFREDIDAVMHQFGHITRLLNDLLDSNRFTQGKINIALQPTELIRIVEQVVKSLRPIFEEANIQIHLSYPSKQLYLSADWTRLEQVLTNILSNAVKFTPSGGSIWINIKENKDVVSVSVQDNGIGITGDEMKHIFDPYYQGERGKNKNVGLGIGLFLAHQIIRLHNGSIEVTSEGTNKGSQFIITLPLITSPYQEHSSTATKESIKDSPKRIVVVDDNHAAADALVRLLEALGCQATALYSGTETLEHLKENETDLIFLDIGMPDMNGYELIRLIREQDKLAHISAIAITGYGLESDKLKALESGFSAHITKPIGVKEIREILHNTKTKE